MLTKLLFKRKKTSSEANPVLDNGEPLYDVGSSHLYVGDGATDLNNLDYIGKVAERLGKQTVGSSQQPIYLESGAPAVCGRYAGGTHVRLNGIDKAGTLAVIFAPITGGDVGSVCVMGDGGVPVFAPVSDVQGIKVNASDITGTIPFNNLPTLYCGSAAVSQTPGHLYAGNVEISTSSSTSASPTFASVNGFTLTGSALGIKIERATTHTESISVRTNVNVEFGHNGYGTIVFKVTGSDTPTEYTLRSACTKDVKDNSSPIAFTGVGENLVTERSVYYALPSINGVHNYTSNSSIYAPINSGEEGQVLFAKGTYTPPAWEDGRVKTFEEIVTHDASNPVTEVITNTTLREGIYLCEVKLYGIASVLTSVVEVSNGNTFLKNQLIGTLGASLVSFIRIEPVNPDTDTTYKVLSGAEIEYVALYRLKTL